MYYYSRKNITAQIAVWKEIFRKWYILFRVGLTDDVHSGTCLSRSLQRRQRKVSMVNHCLAAGYNTHKDGVGLFKFPQKAQLRKRWGRGGMTKTEEPGRSGSQLRIQFSAANILQKAALNKDQSYLNLLA